MSCDTVKSFLFISKYLIEESVLLLNSEPGMLVLAPLHELIALLAMVGVGGLLVVPVGLAQNKLVVSQAEGVTVHRHGVEVDIGVGTLSLAG